MDSVFKTLLAANNKLNNVCKSLVGLDNLREKNIQYGLTPVCFVAN